MIIFHFLIKNETVNNLSKYTFGFTCTYTITYVEDFIKLYDFIDGENFISINKNNVG